MKRLVNSALRCNKTSISFLQTYLVIRSTITVFCSLAIISSLSTGCTKEAADPASDEGQTSNSLLSQVSKNVVTEYEGLSWQTAWELQQARAATARYRNIENAIKDGYTNINVVVENMGHHYMKSEYVDGTFDCRKPEILVYNPDEEGNFQLVAVEYAVPLNLPRPEGFTGSADVWDGNAGFQLWLLHAWVWAFNSDGVFNPTNPGVHLHEENN
jgi:hypothetical protein